MGLQDASHDVRWIVQQNLDITDQNASLQIHPSDKCLMVCKIFSGILRFLNPIWQPIICMRGLEV